MNYWLDELGVFIPVRNLLAALPPLIQCDDCNAPFVAHCAQARDTYYTCGCGGALCPDCHTNAEEEAAEAAFHAFHSG